MTRLKSHILCIVFGVVLAVFSGCSSDGKDTDEFAKEKGDPSELKIKDGKMETPKL